jgi:hypothetical protein
MKRWPDWGAGVIGYGFFCLMALDMRTIRNGTVAAICFVLGIAFWVTFSAKRWARFIDRD